MRCCSLAADPFFVIHLILQFMYFKFTNSIRMMSQTAANLSVAQELTRWCFVEGQLCALNHCDKIEGRFILLS